MRSSEVWDLEPGDIVTEEDGTRWRVAERPRESSQWGVRVEIRCASGPHRGMRSTILGSSNAEMWTLEEEKA